MSERPNGFDCRCWDLGLRPGMNKEQLREFYQPGMQCTDDWICGNLDREYRRAVKEQDIRDRYKKKLKRQGYTDEEINNRAPRSKQVRTFQEVEL